MPSLAARLLCTVFVVAPELLGAAGVSPTGDCQEFGAPCPPSPEPLTMQAAVREALAKSPDVARLRLALAEVELLEPALLANLDPRFSGGYSHSEDRSPRVSPSFQGTRSESESFNLGLRQNTLLGTDAFLHWTNERLRNPAPIRVLDPSAESQLMLEVRQPMLRYLWGRPDVARRRGARAQVRAARARMSQSEAELIASVTRAYVELWRAEAELKIVADALSSAQRLYNKNSEKRRYGLVDDSDLLQAAVSVQVQETELALAQNGRERAMNALNTLLQRQGPAAAPPLALTQATPNPAPPADSLAVALDHAIVHRNDLRAAQAMVEQGEWALRTERLDTLPDLALVGAVGAAGLGPTFDDAWSDLGGFDHWVHSIGVGFTVPLAFKRERLSRRAQELRLDVQRQELARLSQNAYRETRDAWESQGLAVTRLAHATRLLTLEEKKLVSEEKDFQRGRSSTDLLVRFQQDVYRARSQKLRAQADLALSRLELSRATGRLTALGESLAP